MNLLGALDMYNIPRVCKKCGGVMVFKGVGEKDGRIEISEGSKVYLRCELCGKQLRSGQYCPECEIKVHRNLEAKQRELMNKNTQGFGLEQKSEEGQKRFTREN